MRTWFASLDGAITISAMALLSFVGYALMEMRYYLQKWIPGDSAAAAETVVLVLILGGWLAALFAARDGKRGGLTALLALGGFAVLVALYDMPYVLTTPMPWPEQLAVVVLLVLGVIAVVTVGAHLRSSRRTT